MHALLGEKYLLTFKKLELIAEKLLILQYKEFGTLAFEHESHHFTSGNNFCYVFGPNGVCIM